MMQNPEHPRFRGPKQIATVAPSQRKTRARLREEQRTRLKLARERLRSKARNLRSRGQAGLADILLQKLRGNISQIEKALS